MCKKYIKLTALSGVLLLGFNQGVAAVVPPVEVPHVPPALSSISVPSIPGVFKYMKNKAATIRLGKALFWDMAVGSDGQACASCHFHAGADNRIRNQVSPGLNRRSGITGDRDTGVSDPDTTFQIGNGPNYRLVHADFPLHKLSNPNDRHSTVLRTSNDIISSQGTFGGTFIGLPLITETDDLCSQPVDPTFHVGLLGTRKVEPRHTPTVINAVFFFRTFWDGRANNVLNAIDPFGLRNSQALILKKTTGPAVPVRVNLKNAALGSQALGPPNSDFEMGCAGRSFSIIAQKLLPRRALENQKVHSQDSVLGGFHRHSSGKGLKDTYMQMVKKAFRAAYWKDTALTTAGFTQMQNNFSLFWSVSLQMYQATLISDKAKYDNFAKGLPADTVLGDIPQWRKNRLSASEFRGLELFMGKGKCIACHVGAEFSGAATELHKDNQRGALVSRMIIGDGGVALYDEGFYNIGVTPTAEDIGVGGKDPFGNPLSFTMQYVTNNFVDDFHVDTCTFEVPFDANDCTISPASLDGERIAVNGAFKVPILRNVELTGPYMHNGGMMTLPQVINFYNRGGNFDNEGKDADIQSLGLTNGEKNDLLRFLRTLTDNRVRLEKAPFDHPQLFVSKGQMGDDWTSSDTDADFLSEDQVREVIAVGRNGRTPEGLPSLKGFLRNAN